MKYEVYYNPSLKVWTVWKISKYEQEQIKTFKTEKAARNWIAKH